MNPNPKHKDNRIKVLHGRAMVYLNGIRGKDKVALISVDGVQKALGASWTLSAQGYAVGVERQTKQLVVMQRFLLGIPTGKKIKIGHINRKRLDNRRQNLRIISQK